MGKKAKVRFTVIVDGIEAELFSVRDRGGLGILLSSNVPETFVEGDRRSYFVEQHYSVHNTKGIDTTFTQHTLTVYGEELKQVAYIHNTTEHLLWPVYGKRIGRNKAIEKHAVNRNKDILHRIGRYETRSACLFYCVYVCNPDYQSRWIAGDIVKIKTAIAGRYRITVLSTFLNMPSIGQGWTVGISTSTPRRNGVIDNEHIQIQRESIPAGEILQNFWMLIGFLRNNLLDRLNELYKNDPEFLRVLHEVSTVFSAEPLIKHEKATG